MPFNLTTSCQFVFSFFLFLFRVTNDLKGKIKELFSLRIVSQMNKMFDIIYGTINMIITFLKAREALLKFANRLYFQKKN